MLIELNEVAANLRVADPAWRAKIANHLLRIAKAAQRGHIEPLDGDVREVRGVVTVVLTDDAPAIGITGDVTQQQLRDAERAIFAALICRRTRDDVQQAVTEQWRSRRAFDAEEEVRHAEKLAATPWLCEHPKCRRRFETERGAVQHERQCRFFVMDANRAQQTIR